MLMNPDISVEHREILMEIKPQILLLDLRAMLGLCDDIDSEVSNTVRQSFFDEIVELECAMQ